MARFSTLLVLLCAALGAGCQSKKAALEVVCQAPVACAECQSADPSMRAVLMAQHIEANLSNGEVKTMFEALANASPEGRAEIMRAELDAEGITECPMLDTMVVDVEVDLPPPSP